MQPAAKQFAMKMKIPHTLLCLGTAAYLSLFQLAFAQIDTTQVAVLDSARNNSVVVKRITITVLAPLYLDSLFEKGKYTYGNNIPRFALTALEFYNGVQVAADWLEAEGLPVDIQFLDTRRNNSTSLWASAPELNAADLIIGMAQSASELRTMASLAARRNIPLVSATYPNDGNVSTTPNLMIVNSTLPTHCYSIYRYLQAHHSLDNVILISRKSNAGDFVKSYFVKAQSGGYGSPLNWNELDLKDDDTLDKAIAMLDSTRQNTILVSSLNEGFAQNLVRELSKVRGTYAVNVFGMPTWGNYKLNEKEFEGVDIYYTTPFADEVGNPQLFAAVKKQYFIRANSEPSDMALRGFETTYRFAKTLLNYPTLEDFLLHVNDGDYKAFSAFDLRPVIGSAGTADYYENSKLYMVHLLNGIKQSIK